MYIYGFHNLLSYTTIGPLVELLATTDPLSHTEAMVYGLGAVKLMASNAELRAALKTMGVVSMLAECLRKCSQVLVLF